ncbi:hypothetical protein [Ruegeria arenilitoris]|uniref:hypothetical protein n=1 Tax=Ruegeria arenilitoris TaxID=1173585 RepID=UPI00147EF49C|nr:hypothetical protein [Ruegeria arenilitoris]
MPLDEPAMCSANPIYIGKIRHKTKVWDGQHDPIVDDVIWERVQEKLQAASARPRGRKVASLQSGAPLTGKLRDEAGDRLTPTHTRRHGRQIRYYVSNRLISGGTDPRGWRLPAMALEREVANAIARHIDKHASDHRICATPDLNRNNAIGAKARPLARRLSRGAPDLLQEILDTGRIRKNDIVLKLKADALAEVLELQTDEIDHSILTLKASFELRRRGVEGKVIVGDRAPQPDRTLLRSLARAHTWVAALRSGQPLSEIAFAAGHTISYIRSRSRLAFLSPEIQRAILEGQQPTDLTLERIIRKPMPLDWEEQARVYGFKTS